MIKHLLKLLLLAAMFVVPWATQAQSFNFSCDFEDDSDTAGWVFANGSQTNQWYIGSATNNGGSKSLYISNNNGTSNAYTNSTTTFVYAYQEFSLEAGGYAISYDWKCYGESNYDYIRVFLAPATFSPTAGQDPTGGTSAYSWSSAALPSGFISLCGPTKLNLQSTWQNFFQEFTLADSGTYRLVFAWANDASGGSTPPGAIDNIQFLQPTCPRPGNLQFANITPTSFDFTWTEAGTASSWLVKVDSAGVTIDSADVYDTIYSVMGRAGNTVYNVSVAALCDAGDTSMLLSSEFRTPCTYIDSLPWFEDFEDSPTGGSTNANFAYCWTRLNNGTNYFGYPYVSSSSTYNHTPGGTKGLYWYNSITSGTYGDYQVIVMPGVDTNLHPIRTLQVRFWSRASSTSYSPVFQVGVMTNPNDNNTFQPVDTVYVSGTTYTEYEAPLGRYADTGCFVAIRAVRPASSWYAYVDDITLEAAPTCPRLTELNITATAAAARITWDYSTTLGVTPDYFEVAYRYTEDTLGTPTTVTTTSLNYILTGLDPDTSYTLTVTPNCGTNGLGQGLTQVFSTAALPCLEWDTTGTGGSTSPTATYAIGTPGTSSTNVMPVNGGYNYSYCNHVILASEVNSGAVYFSGIDFDYAGSAAMTATTNCSIYMCHTTMTTCTDFAPTTDLQLVYEGPINCTDAGWNHFEFNRGTFAYNGTSNIIVAIVKNSGATETGATFRYQQTSNSMSHRVYNNNTPYDMAAMAAASANNSFWRSNMRLTTGGSGGGDCIQEAYCYSPSAIIDSVSQSSISISWIPGYQETSWDVDYRLASDTVWTNAAMATTTTDYTITGLTANTQYMVRVVALCSDTNIAAELSVRTDCGLTPLPFIEDFETFSTTVADPLPDCWWKKTNYSSQYPYASTSYNHSTTGNRSMYMYSTSSTWSYMVLPEFAAPIDSLQVRFWLRKTNSSYNHRLIVGVVTDPTDETTFVPIDTVQNTVVSTWEEFTIPMVRYTDTVSGAHIAIMSPSGEYSYPYLDDLTVEYVPDCLPVDNLDAINVTQNSADIVWEELGSATSWTLEWGPAGFTPGSSTGASTIVYASDTVVNLTGLTANTEYEVYVTPDCGSGIAGVTYLSFHTACGATPVPFYENFDNFSSTVADPLPDCWWKNTSYSSNYPYASTGYNHNSGGSKSMYMYSTSSTYTYMVLPEMGPTLDSLQVRFWLYRTNSSYAHKIIVGVITDETDVTTFVPVDTVQCSAVSTWEEFTVPFVNYADTVIGARIALMSPNGEYSYPYLDELAVEYVPDCLPVENLALVAIDSNMLSFTWTEVGDATSWNVEYGPAGFTRGTGTTATVTAVPYTINGLTANTDYDIYVSPECGSGVAGITFGTFRTANTYLGLPFVCNFEDTNQHSLWVLENGSMANKWYIGTAASNGGSNGLYISSDNGTSNTYNGTSSSCVYAYVDLMLPAPGEYGYTFDWKCQGESSFDFLRAALVPVSQSLTAGSSLPSGLSATSMPSTWISLDGNTRLNLQNTWQTQTDVLNVASAGVYHMVFVWRNDGSVTNQPPIAIDNIEFMRSVCPRPDSITITNLTQTSADISWTEMGSATEWEYQLGADSIYTVYDTTVSLTGLSANTAYTFKVRSVCDDSNSSLWQTYSFRTPCGFISLPFTEDFESASTGGSTNSSFADCWYRLNNGTSYFGYPYVSSSSTYNHTTGGTKGLYWYCSTTTGTYGDYQCIAMPPLDSTTSADSLQVSFWARTSSASYTAVFQVGVMTDPNDITSFVGVDTVVVTGTTWTNIEVPLSTYTGNGQYVAIKADRSSSYWYAYVDDISLDYTPTCIAPRDVHATDATTSTLTIDWTDITPAMEWMIEYGPQGYTQGSADGTLMTVTSHPVMITGLDTLTNYDIYVRPICTVGDSSRWYYPTTLTTAMCDNSEVFTIGSPSSTGTSYYAPVNNFYNYTLTETIIDSAEIGGPMDIEYIGYYYANSSPSTYKTNCTIYFQPTTLSTFASSSSAVALDSTGVMVYTGALNCQEGWNFFALDTVYSYDGLTNLMIIVDDNSGDYDGSAYVFKTEPCTGNKTIYYYSDGTNPSVTSPSSFSGSKSTASWRTVMQLVSCSGASCPQPIITSETHDYQSATITWSGTGTNYEVNIKETSALDWPATDIAVTGTTYTFTGLNSETAYTFRVRQDCTADSNDYSEWTIGGFTTDSLPCLAPDSLVVSDLTNAQGTFSWTVLGNETQWDIHVWTSGGLDSVYRVTTNPATVGGFTAGVTYNAAVRAICGTEEFEGDYSDTITFTTLTCPDVTGLTTSNVTSSSVTLNWTADAMAESWMIEYGFRGFAQGTGTSVTSDVNTYVVTGLDDETAYDFYVKAVCGDNWNSEGWTQVTATTLTAEDPTYTVTVNVNDDAMGSTTGGGTFHAGESCTVTATANDGYHFVNWSNGVTDNPYTFTVVANITLTANFAANGTQGIEDVDGTFCTIYPNPTSDVTTISVSGVNGKVRITVVDMNGRTVASETLECSSDCEKTMDVDNLAQGAYFVKITGENLNMVKKLVVR